jgi:serine/threonine protein kinase
MGQVANRGRQSEFDMSKLSLDKFIELLGRSQLVEEDRLSALVGEWKSQASTSQLDDAQSLAQHLTATGILTAWQCHKLLEGRHRGFYLGKYKLLDHLGTGGMSSVYLAEHVLMHRRVAIKVLPQNRVSDSSYLARFHFEAQAAAALDHSNIVRVYDLDNDGRIHYLVMEYTEGTDLDALVSRHGPLDFHAAAEYIAQTATGLEHAHQCGLVHRDIKPANLLVDLKGTVKILDMGLAKFTAETRPAPNFAKDEHVLGTADYLAPEQAVNSQTVDHRADIYSLGCTFYFLLTGHPPFAEGTSLERMTAHQHRAAPSILLERPDAPPEIVAICRRMMEKQPANRYQTAAEVEQALSAWLAGEAAFGRVPKGLHLASVGILSSLEARNRGRSHVDLVSGSASDLRELSKEPPDTRSLFSGLQDTDPNLQPATIRIPKQPSVPRSDSTAAPPGSDVLPRTIAKARGSDTVLAAVVPPIVAPPIETPPTSTLRPPSGSAVLQGVAHGPPIAPEFGSLDDPAVPWLTKPHRPAQSSNWLWVAIIGGLVLITLALVALTR